MLRLTGFTREDRFSIVARVTDALTASGAWILDHHQFSNLALSIQFEIEAKDLPALEKALRATVGLELSPDSWQSLDRPQGGAGSLQIVFVHNDPGERIPGPLG